MIAVLTTASIFIAIVLAIVHWKTVREVLLWTAVAIGILSIVLGLLAGLGAVIVFLWAAIAQNSDIVPAGIALLIVFLALMLVAGALLIIEEHDRATQLARFRAWARARYGRKVLDDRSDTKIP